MSKTERNLKEAFAGESQANRKYLAFAKKADDDGYPQIARYFRAAAEAETIHAHTHLREMGGIKSTRENLMEAVSGETFEFQKMYPAMIAEAQQEGVQGALRSFNYANEAEKVHAAMYQRALENMDKQDLVDIFLCPLCGNIFEGEAPDSCPICKALKKVFRKIN